MVASTGGFGIESLLRGVVGIITVLAVSYLMSSNRKKIDWKRERHQIKTRRS